MLRGNLLLRAGRYDDAETLFLETLRIRRKVLGEDHPDTLDTQNYVAWLWLIRQPVELRKPDDALELALDVAAKTDHQNAEHLDTLALAYHRTGDLYYSMGMHAGLIFAAAAYGALTVPVPGVHLAYWGSGILIDGWMALLVLSLTMVALLFRLPRPGPEEARVEQRGR